MILQVDSHTIQYPLIGAPTGLHAAADIYTSRISSATPASRTPLAVFYHGGCLLFGDRKTRLPDWLLDELVMQRGWTLLSADYRLLPESSLSQINDDIESLGHYIHSRLTAELTQLQLPPVDLSKVVVIGASAGGYCALQAGWRWQKLPRAIVDLYGMPLALTSRVWYNMPHPEAQPHPGAPDSYDQSACAAMVEKPGEPVTGFPLTDWSVPRMNLYRYLIHTGKYWQVATGLGSTDVDDIPVNKRHLFPCLNITSKFPPTFVLHGTADVTVPFCESEAVARALQSATVEHTYISVPDKGHGLDNRDEEASKLVQRRIVDFLLRHLA